MMAPDTCIEPIVTEELANVALRAMYERWPAGVPAVSVRDMQIAISAALRQIEADAEEEWATRPTGVRCAAEVAARPCRKRAEVPWRDRNESAYCWQHAKARAKAGAA